VNLLDTQTLAAKSKYHIINNLEIIVSMVRGDRGTYKRAARK
jgi:hypothetical protein